MIMASALARCSFLAALAVTVAIPTRHEQPTLQHTNESIDMLGSMLAEASMPASWELYTTQRDCGPSTN